MYRRLLFVLIVILLINPISCKKDSKTEYKQLAIKGTKNKSIQSIKLDTIVIDKSPISYIGHFFYHHNHFYFADKIFSSVYQFDIEGNYLKRFLGMGTGPSEMNGALIKAIPFSDSSYVTIDGSWNIYHFNKDFKNKYKQHLNWNIKKAYKDLLRFPKPGDRGIYELSYAALRLKKLNKHQIGLSISSSHPRFNPYYKTRHNYYNESFTIAAVDIRTGMVDTMLLHHSPVYQKFHYIPNFQYPLFEMHDTLMYAGFEIDSLIYCYNYPDSPLYAFGFKGREMNQNYPERKSFEQSEKYLHQDRETYGYYKALTFVESTNLLFRTYQKGKKATSDGLQIYKNMDLIGDVDVPKGFKILGYKDPYYFAQGQINEIEEHVVLYKFKLK